MPPAAAAADDYSAKPEPEGFAGRRDGDASSSPGLVVNHDLRPTTLAERAFSARDIASLWLGLVVGVPSYYLAGSLVDLGMAWWQGVAVVVCANAIVLVPLVLAGHPGVRYGIPFPVLARAAFGVRGAHIPALLRSLVACGWFGIETWVGGQAIFILLLPSTLRSRGSAASSPQTTISPLEFACFAAFWAAQLAVMWKGMPGIRRLQRYSAPVLVVLTSWLFVWVYVRAGGLGRMVSLPPRLTPPQFWRLFFPSLTANIGSWATLAVNIPDFTRHCRRQRDQILGQAPLPLFMGAFTFVGLAVTSATEVIFGRTIPNPVELLGEILADGSPVIRLVAILGVALVVVTTNVPANVVAPANTLVSLSPSTFSFHTAVLATALVGVAFQPWWIFASSENYVKAWLVGCSAVMGPISGIVLADYYVLRRRVLEVEALYTTDPRGGYYYRGGYNPAAMAALAVGVGPLVPGFLHEVGLLDHVPPFFVLLYGVAWFFGCFSAALVYWILSIASGGKTSPKSACGGGGGAPPSSLEAYLLSPQHEYVSSV